MYSSSFVSSSQSFQTHKFSFSAESSSSTKITNNYTKHRETFSVIVIFILVMNKYISRNKKKLPFFFQYEFSSAFFLSI